MLMEPESRAERWKGYFEKLLNGKMPAQPVTHVEYERPEPYVDNVSLDEVKSAIIGLKNPQREPLQHYVRVRFPKKINSPN